MSRHGELSRIVALSLPVVIAELGWVFMGVVDTVMVGSLGPEAIGAVSLGNAMFDVAGFCGPGDRARAEKADRCDVGAVHVHGSRISLLKREESW